MAHLLAKAVIAVRIYDGGLGNLQAGFGPFRRRSRLQAVEDILDVLGAGNAGTN
jgi:hypothetical protein